MFSLFLLNFFAFFGSCYKVEDLDRDVGDYLQFPNESMIVYAYLKDNRSSITNLKTIKRDISLLKRTYNLFPTIKFASINCANHPEICKNNQMEPLNSITLFTKFDPLTKQFEKKSSYTNEISLYALSSFISYKTKLKPINQMHEQKYLSYNNFTEFIKNHQYTIIFFTSRDSRMSQLLLPTISEISDAYSEDQNIGVAEVECKKYLDLCLEANVDAAPTIRVYKNKDLNNFTDYINGIREFRYIIDYTNKECHSFRKSEGKVNMSLYLGECSYHFLKEKNSLINKKDFVQNDIEALIEESERRCGKNTLLNQIMHQLLKGEKDNNNINDKDEMEAKLWILTKLKNIFINKDQFTLNSEL